jgi:hypothetical protein
MTSAPNNLDPDTSRSTQALPAESEHVSGDDTTFLSTEDLDHRTFDEMERLGQPPLPLETDLKYGKRLKSPLRAART